MRLSLQWKWMGAHLITALVVLLIMFFYLSGRLKSYFQESFEERWGRELALVAQNVALHHPGHISTTVADSLADTLGKTLNLRLTIISTDGRVLGDSRIDTADLTDVENHIDRPEVVEALQNGVGKQMRFSTTVNEELLYFARKIERDGELIGIVRIAVPLFEIEETLSEIQQMVWFASLIGLVFVLVVGFLLSKSLSHRMGEMIAAAHSYAQGDFSRKLKTDKQDELTVLSNVLNQMAGELQNYISQITREKKQLEAIINSMVEGVLVLDRNGIILLYNNSFQRIFELEAPIIGLPVSKTVLVERIQEAAETVLQEGKGLVETIEVTQPARKDLEAHIEVLGTSENPSGLVIVFHDITQIKHLERVRSDFVANVSHELRTPLTAIKGYAETLLGNGGVNQDRARDFLSTILRHSDRMSQLVEDLLILSKLESFESDEQPVKFNIKGLVDEVVNGFSSVLERYELEIICDVSEDLPKVEGLPNEIETVLQNLIDNAIKYGAQGKQIYISAAEEENQIKISISDQGLGIPADDQPRIFERFYRVDKGRSRQLGGTGLGLSIVKHIVQRHQGQIWVESEPGRGSTFHFTIPKTITTIEADM
jgi:two-component system phosphate regulon sensor histidine kinase PhoR